MGCFSCVSLRNVRLYEFCGGYSHVILESFCLDPFRAVIGHHKDVFVTRACCRRFKRSHQIQSPLWKGSIGRIGWCGMWSHSLGCPIRGCIVYKNYERLFLWSATIAYSARFSVLWCLQRNGRPQFCDERRGVRHLSRTVELHVSRCRPSLCDTKYS